MVPALTRAGIGNPGDLAALAGRHGFGSVDCGCDEAAALIAERGLEGARACIGGVRLGAVGLPAAYRSAHSGRPEVL